MKLIKVVLGVSSLLFANLLSAQEIEVINEAQEDVVNTNQTTQTTQTMTNTQVQSASAVEPVVPTKNAEQVQQVPQITRTVPQTQEPEDDWSLMAQLLETKKRNVAEAKVKIDALSEENEELNIVVEENLETLEVQKNSIGSLEVQLNALQTSASQIDAQLATMQENTDTVSYEFKKLKFKNNASKLTPFLYAATTILISNQLDMDQDQKVILGLAAFSGGSLLESTDYGLSFQLTKLVYKK